MAAEFKVGDTVQLKSGGPIMTVEIIDNTYDFSIRCAWFNGSETRNERFVPETLKKTT